MTKVKQQFFKTAGGQFADKGISLSTNCQRVFVTGYVVGATACDFSGNQKILTSASDIFVAGLDHNGNQKFFKTAGSINGDDKVSITSNCHCAFLTGQISGNTATDFNGKIINGNNIFVAGLDNCGNQKFFSTAGGNNMDLALSTKIVHDDKCIYITGLFAGADFQDFNKTLIPTGHNIFVAGLDNCGHQKFFITAGSPADNYPLDLTVNDKGVFVTGYISPGAVDFKGIPITNYGQYDAFIAGITKCGTQKFFKHAGVNDPSGEAFGLSIISDCHDIFVTGLIGQSGINFAGNIVTNSSPSNIFVAGLDACGNQKFFVTAGGSTSALQTDRGFSISTNDHGVFVTGRINGPNAFDFKQTPVTLSGDYDIFVAGLSKCGTQKFFVTAGGSVSDQGLSITSNEEGIFVTGVIAGPTATDFCGKQINHLQGNDDIFVAKFDFCGHQQFFLTAGSNQVDVGRQIVVHDNEIYVTGWMGGTTGINFKHCPVTTLKGNGDIFVARLDDLCGKYRSSRSTMPYVPR